MVLSFHDLLVMRCCHACKQGVSSGYGTFHTNDQIISCASICDICSAIANDVFELPDPLKDAKIPYCAGDYIFEVAHAEGWSQLTALKALDISIPYKSWKYVEALDRSGICVNSVCSNMYPSL